MKNFFIVVMVIVVVLLFAILVALAEMYDVMKSIRFYVGLIDDSVCMIRKVNKTDVEEKDYKKKYKKLKKKYYENLEVRIGTLEDITVSISAANEDMLSKYFEMSNVVKEALDGQIRQDHCIECLSEKYQSMVETVDEVVDDQLQQDAEHEKAIEIISEKLKLISDCLDRELGTGIDVILKFEEMDDEREELHDE